MNPTPNQLYALWILIRKGSTRYVYTLSHKKNKIFGFFCSVEAFSTSSPLEAAFEERMLLSPYLVSFIEDRTIVLKLINLRTSCPFCSSTSFLETIIIASKLIFLIIESPMPTVLHELNRMIKTNWHIKLSLTSINHWILTYNRIISISVGTIYL